MGEASKTDFLKAYDMQYMQNIISSLHKETLLVYNDRKLLLSRKSLLFENASG